MLYQFGGQKIRCGIWRSASTYFQCFFSNEEKLWSRIEKKKITNNIECNKKRTFHWKNSFAVELSKNIINDMKCNMKRTILSSDYLHWKSSFALSYTNESFSKFLSFGLSIQFYRNSFSLFVKWDTSALRHALPKAGFKESNLSMSILNLIPTRQKRSRWIFHHQENYQLLFKVFEEKLTINNIKQNGGIDAEILIHWDQ